MKAIYKKNILLFIPLFILMIISFFCMYQAKFIRPSFNNYLYKQIIWFIVGFIILFILKKTKIKFLFEYSFILYLISNILLILVLFIGHEAGGARAWFNFKIFNFQPSEFMKITLSLYLANICNDFNNNRNSEFKFILKCIIITLIPSILVFLEPDTGAVIFYLLILFAILLVSKIKKRWFIISFAIAFIIIFLGIYLYIYNQDLLIDILGNNLFYRIDRLISFKNGSGMQLNNALTTIGSSSVYGSFIKKNILYVPELPTDFIFTLIISIFGFVGAILVLISFLVITLFLINIYSKNIDLSYKAFINTFILVFIFQQIQNIFMNIGLLPIMGIPLPFLSYGGSNMIVYFIYLGIILNIKKQEMNLVYLP